MNKFRIKRLFRFPILCVLMALFFICGGEGTKSQLAAHEHLYYDEIRIHGNKIDSRFRNWRKNVELHAEILEKSTHPNVLRWREQIAALDFSDELKGLKLLNSYINNDIRYIDDYHHFHKKDYWADPLVAITEGGDCEDIALTKSATLHRLGWPEDRRHLLIGYLTERGKESHAVLLVETTGGEQYILRSMSNEVIKPSGFKFIPIYAVDGYGTLIIKPHTYPKTKKTPHSK